MCECLIYQCLLLLIHDCSLNCVQPDLVIAERRLQVSGEELQAAIDAVLEGTVSGSPHL